MKTFTVHYLITCYEGEQIDKKLTWICLEQSVELPKEVVPENILDKVSGQVSSVEEVAANKFKASIEWPIENVGKDQTQFLNVLYGNISLKRGIKISSVDWEQTEALFSGAMFGIDGIRERMGIHDRPMACAVLKPMGLSPHELAALAKEFAMGGMDMIKDDHGLANQSYASFEERVTKVSDALQIAMNVTGILTHYFPNITSSGAQLMERYELAADCGADGVMVIPELCGYEAMHQLAGSELDLPIIAHPAFSGTFVTDPEHGFTPAFLYGEIYRAYGADFTVYPNTGGRFSFSSEECHELNTAARNSTSPFKSIFPMPGGGMDWETLPHWRKEYGNDTVFLLGASLLKHPSGVRQAAKEVQLVLEGGASEA